MGQKQPRSKAFASSDDERKPERPEARRDGLQGEGNHEAAQAFNKKEREFVESGKVPAAARAAAPESSAEQQELIEAEKAGKRRAKE